MNLENPTLTAVKESRLQDGVEVILKGKVFSKSIFDSRPMFNCIEVYNKKEGFLMGRAFYEDPMDEKELEDKLAEVAGNPDFIETILFPGYQKNG